MISRIRWTDSDEKSIRAVLRGGGTKSVEKLSSRLGVDSLSLRKKVDEIKNTDRIRRMVRNYGKR